MKKSLLDPKMLFRAARVLRILAHPVRLHIIEQLKPRKRSVGELAATLGLQQAVVSKHLAILKNAGVLASQTDCNYRYYSLANTKILEILNCIKKSCPKEV